MPDPTIKHYHVDCNEDLFSRHQTLRTRVSALGMVYPGQLDNAPAKMGAAAECVQNDQDLYSKDVEAYISLMDDVAIVSMELAPHSGITEELQQLRHDTVLYITNDTHYPETDFPSEAALEYVDKYLEPIMRPPYLTKDARGKGSLPADIVRVRMARLLTKIEVWPEQ